MTADVAHIPPSRQREKPGRAFRWIGQNMKRVEDPRLLAGQGRYVDDVALPGMLHAALARSEVAHGHVRRVDVSAAFLSPLLLHAQMVRSVAVTLEPVSPLRAMREVEAARTSDLADEELRGRMGFVETAGRRRVAEATAQREEELADGHAAVRFAGFVTVSARDEEALEHDCAEVEHAAQMARLELIRLYGQQDEAFTYTLPLCRGLR